MENGEDAHRTLKIIEYTVIFSKRVEDRMHDLGKKWRGICECVKNRNGHLLGPMWIREEQIGPNECLFFLCLT